MKRIIQLLATALLLASCSDDAFLTEDPKYLYTPDNAFSTQDQVDQTLLTCYSSIRDIRSMRNEGREYFVFRMCNGTDMYDVTTVRHAYQFNDYANINPEHSVFKFIFNYWYRMISYANMALYAAELPQITWDSAANKAYAIAQAHFFRAYAYMNLAECFGGVFIVEELCTEPRFDFERSSRVDTYQYAIDELKDRLEDFPEVSPTKGKLVRGAAQHILAQLYLDKGIALEEEGRGEEARESYGKSAGYASDLIDGGIYSLMTNRFGKRMAEGPKFYYANISKQKTPNHTYAGAGVILEGNVFWDMFQTGNIAYQDGNHEAIWTINISLDAYVNGDRTSRLSYSRCFAPSIRESLPGILDGTMEDTGGRGVTWVCPTHYARDQVWEGKWGEGDIRNSETCNRRTFLGNAPGSAYYGRVIPWSVIYHEGADSSTRQAAYTQAFPISCKVSSDIYPDDDKGGNKSNLYRDDYLIRLAETYLIRAEARMRAGDMEGAAADINAVRSRAKASYMVTAADMNLDLILDERARELIFEENRWNTLLRMGGTLASERIREYSYWDYPRSGTMKNFGLWPIPQTVIDTNKDVKIEQNEGWN